MMQMEKRQRMVRLAKDFFAGCRYVWCLHCERVYPVSQWIGRGGWCPGCRAGAIDGWNWDEMVGHYDAEALVVMGWKEDPEPGMVFRACI